MGLKNWWYSKRKLERVLIIVVALLCFVLVVFIILLSSSIASRVCHTAECVRTATHILDTIDPSVDPCDNFYKFACGTFLKNALPLGQHATLNHLTNLMRLKMKEIVVETTDDSKLSEALVMQRKFYKACIDERAIEEDKDRTFLKLLDDLLGGWPVVKGRAWDESNFSWGKAMVRAKQLGFFYQFFFRVGIYSENGTNMLWIKPPYERDVSSFYWQEQNIDLIKEIAQTWKAPKGLELAADLRRTMYFADELDKTVKKYYNKTTTHETDASENITLKDLGTKWINMSWIQLLSDVTGVPLKEDDPIVVDSEDYFEDLAFLLLGFRKQQANYIAWAAISTNIHYMTKRIRDRYDQIQKNSNVTTENLSRDDSCYTLSKNIFKNVAEGEYIRRYTPLDKRGYIKDMIKNVKQALKNALQINWWMDSETKDYAIGHLENIKESIGWTDIVYDVTKYERSFGYHNLNITSDKAVDIARAVVANGVNHYFKQLHERGEQYLNTPRLHVNAYYVQYFNILMLPSSILDGQIFNQERPHYTNYGSLGSIIGHEFTHGFMDFSPISGLPETSWWTNTTRTNFIKTTECIVDEYNTYPEILNGYNKNGSIFEENIADFSGVNFAYNAYQYWVSRNGREQTLPGIRYTPNQVFWIMASTYLCYEPRLAEENQTTEESRHAVPSFRVIGPLRNSPYFANDFNCPVGSKMNPERKCRIF